MAGQVLGGRVEHDVGAERERALDRRGREGVVDDDERSAGALPRTPFYGPGHFTTIYSLEQRVGRRLEPDESRSLRERLPQGVHARFEIDERRVDVAAGEADLLEVAVGPAVHVIPADDLVAGFGELGDRSRGRGSGREREPVLATLERRDRALEPDPRRVLRAGVFVAATRLADRVLLVCRCLVDRRGDGAGQLVRLG